MVNPLCKCGHGFFKHEDLNFKGIRSSNPCHIQSCNCKDFQEVNSVSRMKRVKRG